jgi:hypothetical protein
MVIKEIFLILGIFFILFSSVFSFSGNIGTKKYDIDAAPKDLVWCGTSRETVLLLSENNSLYRSDDKGFNWRLLNGILTSTGKDQLEENENEVIYNKKIFIYYNIYYRLEEYQK